MKFMQFLEGDKDASAMDHLDVPELDLGGDDTTPAGDDTLTPEPEPKSNDFDPQKMAAAFAEGLKTAGFVPQPKVDDQPKLSPEEAKKLLNVWEPTKEWQTRYDNLETREKAIQEMRDGVIKQSDTITQYRMQQFEQKMQAQYAPVQQAIAQQQAEAVEKRFDSSYPDLAKPELKPLIGQVIAGLSAKQVFKPGDEAGNFKLVAQAVESVIKVANPNFKLTPKGSTPTGQPKNNNALRPTSSGSGGGTGGKQAAPEQSKSKVLSLLE